MEPEDGVITVSGGGIAERISQLGMQQHTTRSQKETEIPKAMKLQESRIPYRSAKGGDVKTYPLRPLYRAAVGFDLSKNTQSDMFTNTSLKMAGEERMEPSKCDVTDGVDPFAMVPYRGALDEGQSAFQPRCHSSPRVSRRRDQENVAVLNGESNVMPSYKAIVMEQPWKMMKPMSSCKDHYDQEQDSPLAQQNRSVFSNKTNQCTKIQLQFPCGIHVFRSKSDDGRRQQLDRTDKTPIRRLLLHSLSSADEITAHEKHLQRQRQQEQEQQEDVWQQEQKQEEDVWQQEQEQEEDVWQQQPKHAQQQGHHKRPRQEVQQLRLVQEHSQVKQQQRFTEDKQQIEQQQCLEKDVQAHEPQVKEQQKQFKQERQFGRQQLIEQQNQLAQQQWERQRQQQWLEQQRNMKRQRRIEQQRQLEEQIEQAWQMDEHHGQNHQFEGNTQVQKQLEEQIEEAWQMDKHHRQNHQSEDNRQVHKQLHSLEEEQQLHHDKHAQQQLCQQQDHHKDKSSQQILQGEQQQPQIVLEQSRPKKFDQLWQDKDEHEEEAQSKLHHQRMHRQQQLQQKRLKLQQHRQRYQQDQQVEQQLQLNQTQLQEQLHEERQVEQQHQPDQKLKQYLQEQEHSHVLKQQVQEVQLALQEQLHQQRQQLQKKPHEMEKAEQQPQVHLKPQEQQMQQLQMKQLLGGAVLPYGQQQQQVQQHLHQRKLQLPTQECLSLLPYTASGDGVVQKTQSSKARNNHVSHNYTKRHKSSANSSTSSVLDKSTRRQQKSHCGQMQLHRHLPQSAKTPQVYYVLSAGELSDVDDTSSSSGSNTRQVCHAIIALVAIIILCCL